MARPDGIFIFTILGWLFHLASLLMGVAALGASLNIAVLFIPDAK
jgi:hypothetical protein